MFYEPNEIKAADKVTASSHGCRNPERLVATPQEDIDLAMTINPPTGRGLKRWIDPKLAAVYVIGTQANKLCKIGYARDLRKRLMHMQAGCPVPLHIVHFAYLVGNHIAKRVEAFAHTAFEEERKHGEWFEIHPLDAAYIIGEAIKENGFVWWDEQGRRDLGFSAARLHEKDWARYSHRGHAHD